MITIRDFRKPEASALTRFVESILHMNRYNDPIFDQCYFKLTLKLDSSLVYFHRMYFESNFLRRSIQQYPHMTDDLIVTFDISVSELLQYISSVIPPVFRKRLNEMNSINAIYDTTKMFLTDTTNPSVLKYNRDAFYKCIGLFDGVISYNMPLDHKRLDYILSKVTVKSDIPISYIEASSDSLQNILTKNKSEEEQFIQFTTLCESTDGILKLIQFIRSTNLQICCISKDNNKTYLTLYATKINDELKRYIDFINNVIYVSL